MAGPTGWSRDRLLPLLGGSPQSATLLDAAIGALKLNPSVLSQKEALLVLEHLCNDPGLVGVAARFAKARVLLT